jgi:hypothetical protein
MKNIDYMNICKPSVKEGGTGFSLYLEKKAQKFILKTPK